MCLVDQLPIGSVLTPATSCTKFKIHSDHADSPMAKTFFSFKFFERASLCFTDQETQEENVLDRPTPYWVSTYTSYLLYKVQDPFSPCRQSHGQNIPFFQFLRRTSLCFTDQETQEENVLGGPTPFWVGSYTSYLLYKVQDPFRPCRQSHCQRIFFFNFSERASLCFIDQKTQEENVLGGPTPLWVSSYTSYVLYKVQDPLRPCRQSHGQNIFFF